MFRHSREIKWVCFKLFQEENKKYMQKIEYKKKAYHWRLKMVADRLRSSPFESA